MGVPYEDKSSFDLPPLAGGVAKSMDYEAVKVSSTRVAQGLVGVPDHPLVFRTMSE